MQDVIGTALTQYGPFAAIAFYLIWQTRKDYQGVCRRLNAVEDWQKNFLCDILLQNTRVIEYNNNIITKCQKKNQPEEVGQPQHANLQLSPTRWSGDRQDHDNLMQGQG
jgi:hypothetical protein